MRVSVFAKCRITHSRDFVVSPMARVEMQVTHNKRLTWFGSEGQGLGFFRNIGRSKYYRITEASRVHDEFMKIR